MTIKIKYKPVTGWITIDVGKYQSWQGHIDDVPTEFQKYIKAGESSVDAKHLGFIRETIKIKLKKV